ncbi:MAG: helix-turn-helix domain-containing protein [Catenulispora sp.]|nr:helix-turn-helix domain-containing protein [Catenulispora sp.]
MSERNQELADFLRRARSKVDPARTGLPADGRVRRVPGLRREEVAQLAQVSADYYTRLEQGRRISPSPTVVDAIARALALDEAGHAHLRHLIGGSGHAARPRTPVRVQRPRPGLVQLLDALDGVAGMVLGRRTDVLATNRLARTLLTDFDRLPARDRNYARWMFLSGSSRERLVDWDIQARAVVENLRLDAGRDPRDPGVQELVGELSIASPQFATWWQAHRVYQRTYGDKRFHHPVVGDFTLQYESLTLPGDADQTLFLYSAEPGTPHREALDLLASWTLTPDYRLTGR